jgi:hypothetical protein
MVLIITIIYKQKDNIEIYSLWIDLTEYRKIDKFDNSVKIIVLYNILLRKYYL